MTVCAECGRENAPDARFCSGCGTALEGADSTRESRKVVTVVFTDVVGSTELGERLDSESLRQVMSRYFDAMQATLERHGGTVEKFIGDAVMAVFGVPTLHEDDALRAVRAAVGMRDELARLNEQLEREYGVRITVRTGVNTGQVVAGDAGARQKLVTGDAVNVAARLEQAAGAGEILLGGDTHRLVRDAVQVEPLEPLALKGKSEPLPAWRLVGLLAEVPAFTRPIAAPFVGRADEFAALKQAFATAMLERVCTLATIVGPPGIGKSRLARELAGALADEAQIMVGRCLPYGEGITYWPLAEIVRQLGGAEPKRRLAELVADDEQAAAVAALIAGAVGAADGAGSPEETAWAFRRLLEALARQRPLLLVVDDIHWAEPTLLDLLEYLVSFSSGAPILILCLARPDLFDSRPTWGAPRPHATLVSLAPLSDDEAQGLIARLLQQRELSERARARIVGAAEGNPLFVEQILAMYAEHPDEEVVVPPTIQALLAARIDRLDPAERAVLERASVEGRLFHRGAVAELLPAHARTGIGAQLMTLIRKEFLRPDQALFAGDDGFRFNHILIRDAAYESISKQLRAELHERYADWLQRRVDGNAAEYDEILGYHLEQAYRYRAELGPVDESGRDLAVRAAERLIEAGQKASLRGDGPATESLLSRGLSLLAPTDPRLPWLLIDLGLARRVAGRFGEAEDAFTEAGEAARAAGDAAADALALVEASMVRVRIDPEFDLASGSAEARRAGELLEALGDERSAWRAWFVAYFMDAQREHLGAAGEAIERALDLSRRADDPRWPRLLGSVLYVLGMGPTPASQALSRGRELLEDARENRAARSNVLANLGQIQAIQGLYEAARHSLLESRAIDEELGRAANTLLADAALGVVESFVGDWIAAERRFRRAYETCEATRDMRELPRAAALLADSLYEQHRDEEAAHFSRVSENADPSRGEWRTIRAKLLARAGEHTAAAALAQEVVALASQTDSLWAQGDAYMDLAQVLRLADRPSEAIAAADAALRRYEQKEIVPLAERARRLLAELEADPGADRHAHTEAHPR